MMTCPASAGLPNTMGPDGNVTSLPYGPQRGQVLLTPRDMPFQPKDWECFASLNPDQAIAFLRATHICSYMCATSPYVNEKTNWCLLNNATAGDNPAAASFCPGFPNSGFMESCKPSMLD